MQGPITKCVITLPMKRIESEISLTDNCIAKFCLKTLVVVQLLAHDPAERLGLLLIVSLKSAVCTLLASLKHHLVSSRQLAS